MLPFKLTETNLQRNATDKSWQRGQDYYRSGSVINLVCRGKLIQAQVEGNTYEPYRITLQADQGGVKSANCTCEYDWGGWCKHIIAVGLACVHAPESVELAPTLDDLLEPLDTEQLKRLIAELVDEQPGVIDTVEAIANRLTSLAQASPTKPAGSTTQPHQRQARIDPEPFKRQTRKMIRDAINGIESGWDEYDFTYDGFPDLLTTPSEFVDRGDGENAQVILAAITATCAAEWDNLEDYGHEGHVAVNELDPLWAEALLQNELNEQEAVDLQIQLEEWGAALGGEFQLAAAALRQGWEDEDLRAVLAGEQEVLWEGEVPDYADDLAQIRLRILARQQRWDEYLNFARIEGQDSEYLVKLVELGRGEEAIALLNTLGKLTDVEQLAKAFREQEQFAEALQVAEYGLTTLKDPERPEFTLSWGHYHFAEWAGQLAEQAGDSQRSILFWSVAIKAQPKLKDFQHLETLSGDTWPSLREILLDYLESEYKSYSVGEEIQIFLASGRVQAAMTRVQKAYERELWLAVMQAAIAIDPDWVIAQAKLKAGEILDRKKADRYDWAVKFLGQMKAAYLQQQNQADWLRERGELMRQHGRKYKFVGLMEKASL